MHLSTIIAGAFGFASLTLAMPQLPVTTPGPTGCPYTTTTKFPHGPTLVVKEYSTWTTHFVTVDCHGCSEIVQQTRYIKGLMHYVTKAEKTKTVKHKEGVVGTKRILVCRTAAPVPASASAKPMPGKLSWKALAKDTPP